ncbi:hypothetical protein ONS96_000993 [Cadophora gregata f. sp. sojae]|nr:hypothetical protein ONS96_000993 [Cadophora gregata f. sp. sojae]
MDAQNTTAIESSTHVEKCSSPILTTKSFFISLGICIAVYIIIYTILCLAVYIKERRHKPIKKKTPRQEYTLRFSRAVMEMKRTIAFGESISGLDIQIRGLCRPENDTRPIGPKDHFAYMLHYIDGVGLDGSFDFWASGERGKYFPELVDVIVGTEVAAD